MKSKTLVALSVILLFNITSAQDPEIREVSYLPFFGYLGNVILKDSIAVVTNDYGLITFDFRTPNEPEVLDYLPIRRLWSEAEISLSNDLVCLQDITYNRFNTLQLFNISDPASIETLPDLQLNGIVRSSVISGDYLYAVVYRGTSYLFVLDISNSDEPEIIDSVEVNSEKILIFNDILVAGNLGNFSDHRIYLKFYSLEDPENPELLGEYIGEDGPYQNSYSKQCLLNDQFLFLRNDNSNPLSCIDLSDPSEPYLRWTYSNPEFRYIVGEIDGYLAIQTYSEEEGSQLKLFSNEDPDTLIEVPDFCIPTGASAVYSDEDLLCITNPTDLTLYDISDFENLQQLGAFYTQRSQYSNSLKIDDYLLVPIGDSTIKKISVANPENPREISSFEFGNRIQQLAQWDDSRGGTIITALENPNKLVFMDAEDEDLNVISELRLEVEQDTVESLLVSCHACNVV